MDHLRRGDDHRDANLQTLCDPCHRLKTALEGAAVAAAQPQRRRAPEAHPGLVPAHQPRSDPMSYRDPQGAELPDHSPESEEDIDSLPEPDDGQSGEEYMPMGEVPDVPSEAPGTPAEPNPDEPPTPGAHAAPPAG